MLLYSLLCLPRPVEITFFVHFSDSFLLKVFVVVVVVVVVAVVVVVESKIEKHGADYFRSRLEWLLRWRFEIKPLQTKKVNPETFCLWNPELNPLTNNPESSTWEPESMAWNPESKTALYSLIWGEVLCDPGLSVISSKTCWENLFNCDSYLVISKRRQALGWLNVSSCLNHTFIRELSCVTKKKENDVYRVLHEKQNT